jgi:hypothetical protein
MSERKAPGPRGSTFIAIRRVLLEDNRTSGNRERETLQCGPQLSDFCIDLPTTQLILHRWVAGADAANQLSR